MKEFLEIMEKDFREENFTVRELVVYGIIAPAAFVLLAIIASI